MYGMIIILGLKILRIGISLKNKCMAKNKFIYDPNSLSYIPIELSMKDIAMKFLPYAVVGVVLGIISYSVLAINHYTPIEKLQEQQIVEMKSQQQLLNERINEANSTLEHLIVSDDSLYRTLLGVKPMSSSLRQAGTGGTDKYVDFEVGNNDIGIIESYKRLDQVVAKMNVQEGSYKELFKKAAVNFDRMQHLPAIIPISNWDLKYIGSGFSPRRFHPILKRWRQHEGIDFIAPIGTNVFASADGVVRSARVSDSFGRVVEIDHGYGLITLYAHLSKINVKFGQKVTRGQVIGLVGNSGLSSGAHLHYEVHVNNVEVDPVNYFFNDLTPKEYKAVVEQAESVTTCME